MVTQRCVLAGNLQKFAFVFFKDIEFTSKFLKMEHYIYGNIRKAGPELFVHFLSIASVYCHFGKY